MNFSEHYLKTKHAEAFSIFVDQKKTKLLLFLHGAGDSHLNYLNFLNYPELNCCDLLIPDLLGYGKSARAKKSFSFSQQVEGIIEQIKSLKKEYDDIILVPHSMAGIHANLLAKSKLAHKIKGIYAIETTITQYGAFISEKIADLDQKEDDLEKWLSI